MNILFIDHNFTPTNDQKEGSVSFYLLKEFAKKQESEIDLLTASFDGEYHLLKMGDNVTIHQLPIDNKKIPSRSLAKKEQRRFAKIAYENSLKLAAQKSYDIAHAFSSYSDGLAAQLLGKKTKLPYVVSLSETDESFVRGWLDKIAVFKVWKQAHFLVADNPRLKQKLLAFNPPKEIEIICKGVDLDYFVPNSDIQKNGQFTILCDSEIVPIKGLRFLVQAFKILSGRYDNLQLLILGEGNEKSSLQNLAQGLDILEKIAFVGNVEDEKRIEYYQSADVFVLPSLDQQADNGINVRKALSAGLPVVATPVHGIEGLVIDGQNGFLVKISTADDLVDQIERLILDESLKHSMGNGSLEIARQLSWENIALEYLSLYIKTRNILRIQEG